MDQCRLNFDHWRSIADYQGSNADYHWSVTDFYRPIVRVYWLYNTMLINTDPSTDQCKLIID